MTVEEPPRKKRKLPALDEAFSTPAPVEDTTKHQGRVREIPHAKGQWASHVFIELEPSPTLRQLLREAYTLSASTSPDGFVHSLLESEGALHVSLSRLLILQTSQREELRSGIAKVAAEFPPLEARYAVFDVLENDPKTRRFLGIELGTGWTELRAIVSSIDDLLVRMRLPPYYPTPRFHTSIAWSTHTSSIEATGDHQDDVPFSKETLEALELKWGKKLRKEELWVAQVCLKIGKDTTRYKLRNGGGV